MYFHLTAAAETLFGDFHAIASPCETLPQDGLNWWVDARTLQDSEGGGNVPVCLMVEDISRYALIFTYTGPRFAEQLPAVLSTRLATHMALTLGMETSHSRRDADTFIDLYQQLAQRLVSRLRFQPAAEMDASVGETFDELAEELRARPRLPRSLNEMIEAEVHANQRIRAIHNDSVMPHEQFAQLMGLYVTSNLMSDTEAERFLNRLGESIGVENASLIRSG